MSHKVESPTAIEIADNLRRLADLPDGTLPEWVAYESNRRTLYSIADRVSEYMGEDGLSESEALLAAYAEAQHAIESKRAQVKAMAARLLKQLEAQQISLEVCYLRPVERRAREAMPRGRKTLACMWGTYRLRSNPRRPEPQTEAAAIAWAEQNAPALVAMLPKIADKRELTREVEVWAAKHGDALPEGWWWTGGDESFSVSVKPPKDDDEEE